MVVLPEGKSFAISIRSPPFKRCGPYLDGIRRECRVEVVDARDWVGDEGFMDGHHLLPAGATVFSRRLGHDVVQPRLAEAAVSRPVRR